MAKELSARGALTAQQRAFIKAYVETGDEKVSIVDAKYTGNAAVIAWELLHNAQIVAGIQAEISLRIRTKGARLAQSVLMAAAEAKDAPWSTRVDAAKALLDRAGMAAQRARDPEKPPERPLSEYSIDELRGVVDRLEREAADHAKPVAARRINANPDSIEAQAVDLIE